MNALIPTPLLHRYGCEDVAKANAIVLKRRLSRSCGAIEAPLGSNTLTSPGTGHASP
jgi:hypothetical protein